ncbi:hypothetical protein Tco_0022644, partial [Tanacetum coccineum]
APAKVVQYQQGFPQGSALGYKPRDRDVRCGEHQREMALTRHVNMFMKLFKSDDKFSQMLTQLESQPEIGGGSGSGGRGDDEQGDDEDDGDDGEDEDDS